MAEALERNVRNLQELEEKFDPEMRFRPTLLMATLAAAPVTAPRGTPRHPHTLATTAIAVPVTPVCYASEHLQPPSL